MLDGPLFESYRQEARRELLRRWTLRLLPVGAVLLVLSAGGLYHLATSSEEAPEPLLPVVPISQAVRPPEAGPEEPVEGPELPTRVLPSGGVLAPAITLLVLKLSVPTEPRELVRGRTSHGRR